MVFVFILGACVNAASMPLPTPAPALPSTATPITLPEEPVSFSYEDLANNTEQYIGKIAQLRGEVVQVVEVAGQKVDLYIRTMDASDGEIVIVHYEGPNVHVGDIVAGNYTIDGTMTYQDESGAQLTAPELTTIWLSVD